jgi:hypothetical protein
MRALRLRSSGLAAAVLVGSIAFASGAQGQTSVTSADVQRLQDYVYEAQNDLSRVSDTARAGELRDELDTLREEVTYLKVKLRKEGSVARREYTELRDRIQAFRSRVTARPYEAAGAAGEGGKYVPKKDVPAPVDEPIRQGRTERPNEVPVGTEIDVRLQTPLSSATSQVEDRFQATTMVDLNSGDRVLIPAGSVVRGVVTRVDKAGRIERTGRLQLSFDQVTVSGRAYPINATVTEAIESSGIRGEAGKIGAGAGVGAIIGGILGGFKGALAGILIGGGGTIAATEGKDVELPAGTVLRLRFDSPVTVR